MLEFSYHVPQAIQKHIDFISPGVHLQAPQKAAKMKRNKRDPRKDEGAQRPQPLLAPMPEHYEYNQSDLSNCDVAITPPCIRALYNVPLPPSPAQPGNAIGIFEDGDFYAQEDLNLFFANFTPYIPQGTHPTADLIDGAIAPVNVSEAGGESALDFELAFPLLYPQQATLYQIDDINYSNGNLSTVGIYNDWLDAIDGVSSQLSFFLVTLLTKPLIKSYCSYSAFGETGNDPVLDPKYPDPLPGGYKGQLQCGVYKPTNVLSVSYSSQEYDKPEYYQKRQCNE